MPHVQPLALHEINQADLLERFAHYKATRGFTPRSIMTMARRPNISRAFMALNQAVLYEGTVTPATKMLVSLASSFAAGCRYCQSHMTNLSSIYQVSDAKIAVLASFETSDLFSEPERAAINLGFKAGALPNEASQADFDRLSKSYSDDEIVELVATVALFGYLNRWNDTMATELETLPADVAKRVLGSSGWDAGKHQ
jgi:uncharacterized peroxidase-related enzyme